MVADVLARETYDNAVFTGDYFDARGPLDTLRDVGETALWLKDSLKNPKHIHLWGNHDVSYGFPRSKVAECSGFHQEKNRVIRSVLGPDDFDKLKFFHIEQGWLFTHAGFHPNYMPPFKEASLENISHYLTEETEKFFTDVRVNVRHWFLQAGYIRGGGSEVGGLLWCDSREFEPIQGIAQIFGHTIQREYPLCTRGDTGLDTISSSEVLARTFCQSDSWNVCLDCNSRYYGVIENGCLSMKPTIIK